jgi:hypothetical protein
MPKLVRSLAYLTQERDGFFLQANSLKYMIFHHKIRISPYLHGNLVLISS